MNCIASILKSESLIFVVPTASRECGPPMATHMVPIQPCNYRRTAAELTVNAREALNETSGHKFVRNMSTRRSEFCERSARAILQCGSQYMSELTPPHLCVPCCLPPRQGFTKMDQQALVIKCYRKYSSRINHNALGQVELGHQHFVPPLVK